MQQSAQGYTAHAVDLDGSARLLLLGPFSAGTVIEDLRVTATSLGIVGGHSMTFGAVVSQSRSETLAAFNAGTSIIQRSEQSLGSKRAILFRFDATGGQRSLTLPVGVAVQRGSVWVLVNAISSDGDADTDLTVSVSSTRVRGEPGGPKAEAVTP